MKETNINPLPIKLELTPEARAIGERIENPQTLEDALLAVRYEQAAAKMAHETAKHMRRHFGINE